MKKRLRQSNLKLTFPSVGETARLRAVGVVIKIVDLKRSVITECVDKFPENVASEFVACGGQQNDVVFKLYANVRQPLFTVGWLIRATSMRPMTDRVRA